jgi:hypothetical protein
MGWLLVCSIIITTIINLGKAFQIFHEICTKVVDDHDMKVQIASGMINPGEEPKKKKFDAEEQWIGEYLDMKPKKRKTRRVINDSDEDIV